MTPREHLSLTGPPRLGDRLLEAGLITRTQLDAALEQQQARIDGGRRLGRTLVELGFLTERDLIQMLSVYLGIPVAPFATADAEERAITSLPTRLTRRYRAMPCRVVGGSLHVAVADALLPADLDQLQTVSGHPVVLYLAPEAEIDAALAKHYGGPSILPSRLRDLASNLVRLAEDHERLALTLAGLEHGARTSPADEAQLRAEIDQIHGHIETLLSALADVGRDLRDRR